MTANPHSTAPDAFPPAVDPAGLTAEAIARLRALSDAARGGPWRTNGNQPQILGEESDDDPTLYHTVARAPQGARRNIDNWRQWEADKAFIVALVNWFRKSRLAQRSAPAEGSGVTTPAQGDPKRGEIDSGADRAEEVPISEVEIEAEARAICAASGEDPDASVFPGITMLQGYTKPSGPARPWWTFKRDEAIRALERGGADKNCAE